MEIQNTNIKLGRNDICPCGSGKKYKKCHGGINRIPAPHPSHSDAIVDKKAPPRKCLAPESMAPECKGGVIEAHTVSRSGSLGAIQRDGHVYSYKPSLKNLVKSNGKLIPQLTGWREASTFPGFCSYHDKKLFSVLEDNPFTGTRQQCVLLAYRAVARELHTKTRSSLLSAYRSVHAKDKENQMAEKVSGFNEGVELGLRDAKVHKQRYDRILESQDWSQVNGFLIEFNNTFPIQCAGGFFPESDIHGVAIQKLGNKAVTPDLMTVISFAADGKSFMLFCWLSDSNESCTRYIQPILKFSGTNLPSVLGSLLLQLCENSHFEPDWYENLSNEGKNWCLSQTEVGVRIFSRTKPPAFSNGETYFPSFSINSIRSLN